MKKLILLADTLGLIALFIACAALAFLLGFAPVTLHAINTWGPAVTETEVRLGDVDIGLFDGEATFKDIYIGSPQGFSVPKLLSAGTVFVRFDITTFFSDPLIIDRIEINSTDIAYEKIGRTDNFKTLLQNMGLSSAAAQPPGSGAATAASQKGLQKSRGIVIRDLVIRQAMVTVHMSSRGSNTLSITVPELHLDNIGGSSGAQPAEVARQVLAALDDRIR